MQRCENKNRRLFPNFKNPVNWQKFKEKYENKDIYEDIRYKFKHYRKAPDDLRELNKAFAKINSSTKKKKVEIEYTNPPSGFYSEANSFLNSKKQQCTVKFRYSNNLAGHRRFVNYYMPQRNKKDVKEKPELFGNVSLDEYKENIKKTVKESSYKKNKKTRKSTHYKWILSPEENLSPEVLKEFTKCFVKRMERETSHPFVWQAVIHSDTPHPHVHLVINGVDKDGKEFRFTKNQITRMGREFSQEILTGMCGERSDDLIRRARDESVKANRWTDYDKYLLRMVMPVTDQDYMGKDFMGCIPISSLKSSLIDRMDFLISRKYAEFHNGYCYLKNDYQSTLQAMSRYNTFVDAKNYLNNENNLQVYTNEMGEIKGTIKKVYSMNDEDVWNNGVVIENDETGEAWYVPYFNNVKTSWTGKNVTIKPKVQEQKGQVSPDIIISKSNEIDNDVGIDLDF